MAARSATRRCGGSLALAALVFALACSGLSQALVIERSGEFTNRTVLEEGAIADYDVVIVTPFHACESLSHMDLTDKIALVVRGECNFVQKVWNAQRANATAVIVMDNELRLEPPFHIIMQKDQHASNIHIPSVFVSYAAGEKILRSMQRALPWSPVKLTLSDYGELPSSKTSNSLLKRIVAYVFLVSVVCVFSRFVFASANLCTSDVDLVSNCYLPLLAFTSGLSLMSSAIFQFIGKRRRTRASRKLPVVTYRRNLQRCLLQQLLETQNVLDHIPLDASGDEDEDDYPLAHIGAMDGASAVADCGEEEACSICLDDFLSGVNVKVLPCQHFYHVHCIEPWLERQSSCCPLCKQDAISTDPGAPPKRIFGFTIPRIEQILQHEHVFHTFFLMLPASIVSCLIVNSAASIISSLWP